MKLARHIHYYLILLLLLWGLGPLSSILLNHQSSNHLTHLIVETTLWGLVLLVILLIMKTLRKDDLAQKQKLHQSYKASQELGSLLDSIPASIVLMTPQGKWVQANRAAKRFFFLENQDISGRSYQEIIRDHPYSADRLSKCAHSNAQILSTGEEYRETWQDNGTTINLHKIPCKSPDGAITGILTIIHDVTTEQALKSERESLEKHVRQALKTESLTNFAGGIAHDFNNLLLAIMGNLDLALLDTPESSQTQTCLQDAMTSAQKAAGLSRQMLSYSGRNVFSFADLNLGMLIDGFVKQPTFAQNQIQISAELASETIHIKGDSQQLRQLFDAIIQNAIEATEGPRKHASIHVGSMECNAKYLSSCLNPDVPHPGDYAFFEITDKGVGMDDATLQRLFDPFFSTKFAGRGLGMAAVLGIVRAHSGSIHVSSNLSQGTCIRILLPLQKAEPTKAEAPKEEQIQPRILLVDDEESVRSTTGRMLKKLGYEVLTADSGEEAIKLFNQHHKTLHCVLLDLSMPTMNGDEVFAKLAAKNRTVPVILSSGYNQLEATSHFLGKGLAGFIQKPYVIAHLRTILNTLPDHLNGTELSVPT
jgi:PAS domain S-box-containing protein